MKTQHTHEMERLWSALTLMKELHEGQTDKCGQPYWIHPFTVAMRGFTGYGSQDATYAIVGLLHDILEDTDITEQELLIRFPMKIDEREALELLTRKDGMSYDDYITSIIDSGNEIAMSVKMDDLLHNGCLSRMVDAGLPITEKDERRKEKYRKAFDRLHKAINKEN